MMSIPPITADEACALFAAYPLWRDASALVVAVSGGPDSVALLWLLARWRRGLADGPYLIAATVDHGLRVGSNDEARRVKRLATSLGIPHVTRCWTGDKPTTGIPAAARAARYDLLARVARRYKTRHVLTAHTQDDQAETLLMRLVRGSGLTGLQAMAPETTRGDIIVARPLLAVTKARLIATLAGANIDYADDPTNRDAAYTRPRLRALLPALASEGLDAPSLARLAMRLGRADAALDRMAGDALATMTLAHAQGLDATAFAAQPAEIRLRLLTNAIAAAGGGRVELGKAEALLDAIDAAPRRNTSGVRLRRTLAGALVTLTATRLLVTPAPPRRAGRPSQPA